ncbi:MAG: hhoB [Planctomycetaceae bacterium]|nr:hhoB [Planctomycetaceae bacterium]
MSAAPRVPLNVSAATWQFVLILIAGALLPVSGPSFQLQAQSSRTKESLPERVTKLEEQAQKCKTAAEAVSLYQIFLADSAIKVLERKGAETKLAEWQKLAAADSVRVGKKWMSKPEELELRKEADELVQQGMVLLQNGNPKQADDLLTKASKIYPEHMSSVFLLALGALMNDNYTGAEKQFTEMLKRAPNNIAILNNLAVAEALNGKPDKSYKHLQQAADLDANYGATLQNLGALVYTMENPPRNKKFVAISPATKDKAAKAFAKLRTTSKAAYNPAKLYVFDFKFKRAEAESSQEEQSEVERVVGNGTGFVIAKNYVLTNKHVVDDADALVIVDPADPKKLHKATVVGVAKGFDLALVKCESLSAAAIPLCVTAAARGTEVLALGFPVSNVVGSGLKSTRGIVTGLPSKETDGMLVSDVQINPGNSGGPLCDSSGRVVGINTAVTASSRFVKGYGLAIPVTEAFSFIKEHLPKFVPVAGETKKKEWTEVDAAVSPSTVMILIRKKVEGAAAPAKSTKPTK